MNATDISYPLQMVVMLAVLASVFYVQYRRDRSSTTLIWFAGWTVVILRLMVMYLPVHGIAWRSLCMLSASRFLLMLGSLLFMASMAVKRLNVRARLPYLALVSIPALAFSILVSLWWMVPTAVHSAVLVVIVLVAGAICVRWALEPGYLPVSVSISIAVISVGISLYEIWNGRYINCCYVLQGSANLSTALLLWRKYRKLTSAVVLASGSFLLWSVLAFALLLRPWHQAVLSVFANSPERVKVLAALGMILLLLQEEARENYRAKLREQRVREELDAYARLDLHLLPGGNLFGLGEKTCRTITDASIFQQAALILRDVERNFYIAGSSGMEPKLVAALDQVARGFHEEKMAEYRRSVPQQQVGQASFQVSAKAIARTDDDIQGMDFDKAVSVRIYSKAGAYTGTHIGTLLMAKEKLPNKTIRPVDMLPLEALAVRLSMAIENVSLTQRLMRSEKLAGLGQMAGGVAHELNNPLTAVLGFAELIEEATTDKDTREGALAIHSEAKRMKRIVESLVRFWRPETQSAQLVSVAHILQDIEHMRGPELAHRGIRLEMDVADDLPKLAGNADQLKQMLLQLLSNAVHAVERSQESGVEHRVYIEAAMNGNRLRILVSDTGPGFADPLRVFDPFFTTKQPGKGTGLGLSICYSIVREHGGEINAVNLHPRGAAVVVELPLLNLLREPAERKDVLVEKA